MGNHRFRFSDMMPNAWFYKLKDMGRTRKHHASHSVRKKQSSTTSASQKSYNSQPRHSYIFTSEPGRADKLYNSPKHPKASDTNFPDPSRKSSKRRTGRKTIYKPSPILVPSFVSAGCSSHATLKSVWVESSPTQDSSDYSFSPLESSPEPNLPESLLSESEDDDFAPPQSFDRPASPLSSGNCKISSSTADIIIDMNDDSCKREFEKVAGFHAISDLVLPPILTKPAELKDTSREISEFRRTANRSFSVKVVKEESGRTQKEPKAFSPSRKSFVSPAGIKLRANSPKIASKKIQAHARKSVSSNTCSRSRNKSISESFAVVKSSVDPQRDFRDSMVEMIVENNIRTSKDLEDLLACYLSLNSNEYHNIIVKAFEQIWFDMTNLHL